MIIMILQMKKKKSEKYNPKNLLLKGQKFTESKKEEKSKSQPQETIVERVKLRERKEMIKTYLTRHRLLLMMIMINLLIFQIGHH